VSLEGTQIGDEFSPHDSRSGSDKDVMAGSGKSAGQLRLPAQDLSGHDLPGRDAADPVPGIAGRPKGGRSGFFLPAFPWSAYDYLVAACVPATLYSKFSCLT